MGTNNFEKKIILIRKSIIKKNKIMKMLLINIGKKIYFIQNKQLTKT